MSLSPVYIMDNVYSGQGGKNVFEIAAAPIFPYDSINDHIPMVDRDTLICLNGEPKSYLEGDTSSNFRKKDSKDLNKNVIESLHKLINLGKINNSQIAFTTFSRDDRYITFHMEENGEVNVNYKNGSDSHKEKDLFKNFLETFKIDSEKMKVVRNSSVNARYRTYMADILSFLLQVDLLSNGNCMEENNFQLDIIHPDDIDISSSSNEKRLRKLTLPNGRNWSPVEGLSYIYFNRIDEEKKNSFKAYIPKSPAIHYIYSLFWKNLENNENDVKKKIRDHFNSINHFNRWSDYNVNDVDDAFTILFIIYAYNFTSLTPHEVNIKDQFVKIIDPWIQQLQ